MLAGKPRSAAARAEAATSQSGRPSRSSGVSRTRSQDFSSASTCWPNSAPSVARRSLIAASRALTSSPRAAPAREKSDVIALQHPRLLGVEAEQFALRLQGGGPVGERLVEKNVVAMPRQSRRDLALDRLDLVVRVRRGEIEKDGRHIAQAPAAALQRLDGVLERRRLRVRRDVAISARASSSAASKAGRKCDTLSAAKGGASNGPVQGSRSGLIC